MHSHVSMDLSLIEKVQTRVSNSLKNNGLLIDLSIKPL